MSSKNYQKVSKAFGQVAKEYDAWYEGNILFAHELKAIKALKPWPYPCLEIGVGSGRFAQALGLKWGLDPSIEMLKLAQKRNLHVICGIGEALPFKSSSLACVAIFFALCFMENQNLVLEEVKRILKPQGQLLLGIVPKESSWGKFYEEKGKKGHPLYQFARFFSIYKLKKKLENMGFNLKKSYSILFSSPKEPYSSSEKLQAGAYPEAGFVTMKWEKN